MTMFVKMFANLRKEDCRKQKKQREADLRQHKEELDYRVCMLEVSQAPCLPAIPKLWPEKDWSEFLTVIEAYLANPQYAPGGDGSLVKSAKNTKASNRLDTALVDELHGDVVVMFQHT